MRKNRVIIGMGLFTALLTATAIAVIFNCVIEYEPDRLDLPAIASTEGRKECPPTRGQRIAGSLSESSKIGPNSKDNSIFIAKEFPKKDQRLESGKRPIMSKDELFRIAAQTAGRKDSVAMTMFKMIVPMLLDFDRSVRQEGYDMLVHSFGNDFGYHVDSAEDERRKAVKKFREWWNAVSIYYDWDPSSQKVVFVQEAKLVGVSADQWQHMDLCERLSAIQGVLGRSLTDEEFRKFKEKYKARSELEQIRERCLRLEETLGRALTNKEIEDIIRQCQNEKEKLQKSDGK